MCDAFFPAHLALICTSLSLLDKKKQLFLFTHITLQASWELFTAFHFVVVVIDDMKQK